MKVFLDTSAFFAILDRDDVNHEKAKDIWINLIDSDSTLVTSNYILLESFALIQRRLGLDALHSFQDDMLPILHIEWINRGQHEAGVAALFQASKKMLSLVDCVSFIFMRSIGLKKAFTFDKHFRQEGFECL